MLGFRAEPVSCALGKLMQIQNWMKLGLQMLIEEKDKDNFEVHGYGVRLTEYFGMFYWFCEPIKFQFSLSKIKVSLL